MATLIGDTTATYTHADTEGVDNGIGQIFALKFTALISGTVDTMQLRTGGATNTAVTSVRLGIYADNGSGTAPASSAAIGQGSVSGQPAINTWVVVSGLSIPVVAGTIYWLAGMGIGSAPGVLSLNQAVASGGTPFYESSTTTFTTLSSFTGSSFPLGPIGIYGTGTASGGTTNTDTPTGRLTLAGSVAEAQTLNDQLLRPASDIATTGWTTTPLFSKINDSSDGTFITATLA